MTLWRAAVVTTTPIALTIPASRDTEKEAFDRVRDEARRRCPQGQRQAPECAEPWIAAPSTDGVEEGPQP